MQYIAILLFFLPTIISILSLLKVNFKGSDQNYHLLIIEAIRQNRNRFILSMPFFVGKNRHSYPQLLHWALSFLNEQNVLKFGKYITVIMNLLSSIALYFFSKKILDSMGIEDVNPYLIKIGVIFSFAPISYDLMNAKNVGLSARGIGLFLGQLYCYIQFLYDINHDTILLLYLTLIGVLIIFTSVFATQFLFFFTILLSILQKDVMYLSPFIIAVLFMLIFFNQYTNNYFIGQFWHKYIYSKKLAKIFILKNRYSIWRDFVFDFWKKLFITITTRKPLIDLFKYIATNPIINLMTGLPSLFFLLFYIKSYQQDKIILLLYIYIIAGLLTFILTSFRITRFLGEPERYVEFLIGLIAIVSIFLPIETIIILTIFSVFYIAFRIIVVDKQIKNSVSHKLYEITYEIKETLISRKSNITFLCESTQLSKLLFDKNYQSFRHPLFQKKIGEFDFDHIHSHHYDYIDPNIIPKVAKYYKLDYLLISSKTWVQQQEKLEDYKVVKSVTSFLLLEKI
jgi:hypothetical protein